MEINTKTMRTKSEIKSNAHKCWGLMKELDAQILILEKEYQTNAIECIGERSEDLDRYINALNEANGALNALAHMEIDFADEVEE